MSKKTNIIVGLVAALFIAVAIFVLFANCFRHSGGLWRRIRLGFQSHVRFAR
jgi:hypothetical protein